MILHYTTVDFKAAVSRLRAAYVTIVTGLQNQFESIILTCDKTHAIINLLVGVGAMKHYESCGMLIKQIHDTLEKQSNNAMRRDDLTMAQVGVLLTLEDAGAAGRSLKELEQILHVAQSTAAGIVVRLEAKGFIESFGDPRDRRVKLVRITEFGLACCERAHTNMENAESSLLAALDPDEKEQFHSMLRKICASLN